jgi:hypothetical protein
VRVSPDVPVDVRMVGPRMEVANHGDETVTICNSDEGACRGREVGPGDRVLLVDERLHWVGGPDTVPPGVDEGDPSPQKVFDVDIPFEYGEQAGTIRGRLDYVGGRTWFSRYGEYALLVGAVLVMFAVFVVDARRRRRASDATPADEAGES